MKISLFLLSRIQVAQRCPHHIHNHQGLTCVMSPLRFLHKIVGILHILLLLQYQIHHLQSRHHPILF